MQTTIPDKYHSEVNKRRNESLEGAATELPGESPSLYGRWAGGYPTDIKGRAFHTEYWYIQRYECL